MATFYLILHLLLRMSKIYLTKLWDLYYGWHLIYYYNPTNHFAKSHLKHSKNKLSVLICMANGSVVLFKFFLHLFQPFFYAVHLTLSLAARVDHVAQLPDTIFNNGRHTEIKGRVMIDRLL